MVVLGVEVGVSDSAAFAHGVAVPVYFDKPVTPSIADPPFTGIDTVTFVVEVEVAPVPGSLGVILEVQLKPNAWKESTAQGDRTWVNGSRTTDSRFSLPESMKNRLQGAHLQSLRVSVHLTFFGIQFHRVRKDELESRHS